MTSYCNQFPDCEKEVNKVCDLECA